MQTLVKLGFIPIGDQFPQHRERQGNPQGYWEDKNALKGEFVNQQDGCVKVMLVAFLAKPRWDCKIILCAREVGRIVESQDRFGLNPN